MATKPVFFIISHNFAEY